MNTAEDERAARLAKIGVIKIKNLINNVYTLNSSRNFKNTFIENAINVKKIFA
ncbi:hypothetical protein [Candidatus Jidaibacter acanthamoebae]|uniref:hypothetical protein n=1 Tax=Candidatus Jidaibacter acanthamoebae TaxID=86105 RepID=UPI00137938D6|nr:hypothetical protein [Candidatus Jidaibacter acanthamoeba]